MQTWPTIEFKTETLVGAISHVRMLSDYLRACRSAADLCRDIYNRGTTFGEDNYLFLDADVICAVLPALRVRDLLKVEMHDDAHFAPHSLSLGGRTMRYLFQNMDRYCIPPGALAELLHKQEQAIGELNGRAKRFLEFVDRAKEASNPASAVLSDSAWNHQSLVEIVQDNVENVCRSMADFSTLSDLLNRATPVEGIWGNPSCDEKGRAFATAMEFLGKSRPAMAANNYFDALNVETVVQVYRHGRSALSRKRGVLPILISNTESLKQIGDPGARLLPDPAPWNFFQSQEFMVIARTFDIISDGVASVVEDRAKAFSQSLGVLDSALVHYEQALRAQDPDNAASAVDPSRIDDVVISECTLACRSFFRDWGQILWPQSDLMARDRGTLVSQLLDGNISGQLRSQRKKVVVKGLEQLRNRIEQFEHPLHKIWRAIWLPPRNPVQLSTAPPLWGTTPVWWGENRGQLLAELTEGSPLESFPALSPAEDMDVRIWALSQFMGTGAFICCDFFYEQRVANKDVLMCCITWTHSLPFYMVLEKIRENGVRTKGVSRQHITKRIFTEETGQHESIIEDWNELIRMALCLDAYLELRAGELRWFCDLEISSDLEQQIGVAFPVTHWSSNLRNAIASFASATSNRMLPSRLFEEVINHTMSPVLTQIKRTTTGEVKIN